MSQHGAQEILATSHHATTFGIVLVSFDVFYQEVVTGPTQGVAVRDIWTLVPLNTQEELTHLLGTKIQDTYRRKVPPLSHFLIGIRLLMQGVQRTGPSTIGPAGFEVSHTTQPPEGNIGRYVVHDHMLHIGRIEWSVLDADQGWC